MGVLTVIAEAFVAVRPDLTDFARKLRQDVNAATKDYKPTINIKPAVLKKDLNEIVREIKKTQATITVQVVLDPKSEAKLKRDLAALKGLVVSAQAEVAGATRAPSPTKTPPATGASQAASTAANAAASASATEKLSAAEAKRVALLARLEELELVQGKTSQFLSGSLQQRAVEEQALRAAISSRKDADSLAQSLSASGLRAEMARAEVIGRAALADEQAARVRVGLIDVTAQLANVQAAEAQAVGTLAKLKATDVAATEAETAAVTLNREAVALGNVELQKQTALKLASAQARKAETSTALALASIQASAARVTTAGSGDTPVQMARARLSAATATERLAKSYYDAAKANDVLTASQKASIKSAYDQAAAIRVNEEAVLKETRAQQKGLTTQSQIRRGTAATGASFLGLRGAVLSSSAGFLGATIAMMALGKVISQSGELQQGLDTFQAVAGATAMQMKAVSEEARKLGADVSLPATSANDAVAAMTELAKAGLSVKDTMDAARGSLQLAAAANIEAGDAAQATASILNQFQLAGSKASDITDLLAAASISAQGSIQDFIEGFRALGPTANQAGVDVNQTTALLTELGQAGLAGAYGGTALKTMLLRLVPASKEAAAAQELLGVQLDANKSLGDQLPQLIAQYTSGLAKLTPIARTDALNTIFGTRGIQAASIVFGEGAAKFLSFQAQVSKAGYGSTLAEARMKGLKGSMDALSSSTQTFATTIGTYLLPALTAIVHGMTNLVNTMGKVAQSFKPVADAFGVLGKLPGGGDAIATIGITIGAAKLLQIGMLKVQASIMKATEAYAQQGAVAAKTSEIAIAGTTGQQMAEERLALATKKVTTAQAAQTLMMGKLAGLRSRLLSGTGAGVGIGIGASLLGGLIGGTAGNTLSGAGTGAMVGSIFSPGVGTAIGAGIGAALSLLSDAQKKSAKDKAELKAKWQAMSFEDQQTFLRINFPDLADPNGIQSNILDLVNSTRKVSRSRRRWGPSPTQTASDFVKAQGGFNISAEEYSNAANLFKSFMTEGLVSAPPSIEAAQLAALTKSDEAFKKFSAYMGAFGITLEGVSPKLKKAAIETTAVRNAQRDLAISMAELTGDTDAAQSAIQAKVAADQKQVAALQKSLTVQNPFTEWATSGVFKIQGQAKVKVLEQINQLIKDETTQYANLIQSINTEFALPEATASLAQTRAAGTKTLADNIAADQEAIRVQEAKLADMQAKNAKKPGTIKAIDIAKQEQVVATARNQLTSDMAAQQTNNEAAVADALSAQEAGLRSAAEAAGNLGAAENKLIVFLKERVSKSKKNTVEYWDAVNALKEEQNRRDAAAKSLIQSAVDLSTERLQTKLSAAQLTDTKSDDKAIYNVILKNQQRQLRAAIDAASKIKTTTAAGTIKWREAQTAIEKLKQTINGTKLTIKGLSDSSSGFSLNDLFKEARSQFEQFGSNVSTSVTTSGSLRGAIAGGIMAQDNKLTMADKLKLDEAATTNKLLRDILAVQVDSQKTVPTPKTIHDDTYGSPGYATKNHAQISTSHVKEP